MFETERFREQITEAVSQGAAQGGAARYENRIVDYLVRLAVDNEKPLMDEELKKATGRRGIPDALNSARIVTNDAARLALAEGRETVTLADMEKAYRGKFCTIWPLCR